jgi:hypothetical protein
VTARHGGAVVASLLVLGLAGEIALHLLEPRLALTWSFAHLGREPWRWWAAVLLVIALPAAVWRAWSMPWLAAPVRPLWRPAIVVLLLVGWVGVALLGLRYPAPLLSSDTEYFARAVDAPGIAMPRWYLTEWTFDRLGGGLAVIRVANALMAVIALVGLAGCARRLGRTRGEALALGALAWSAFGTLQLTLGYVDVYPTVLAFVTVYCWTGLRAVDGGHPAWPIALAAVAPFFYVGLVLLAPSAAVLALLVAARGGEGRRLRVAVGAAVAVAGLATLPGYGTPVAWAAHARALASVANVELGLTPDSALLPAGYLIGGGHLREVLHLLLLVDGIGVLLLVVLAPWLAADGRTAVLASVLVPALAYLVLMDPIFGMFADWDLFSYLAVPTSLAGGWAFVRWGRTHPAAFPLLLGLALAAASVHLLARLNALDVAVARHLAESTGHDTTWPPRVPPGR